MKRGQSALEYLVTYGWAILAIVIIGGVLWYFGIFSPSSFAGASSCAGFAAFTCQDYKVTGGAGVGDIVVVLSNRVGATIIVDTLNASGTGALPNYPATPNVQVVCTKAGQPYTLGTTQLSADEILECTLTGAVVAGANVGSEFGPASVSLAYTDQRSQLSHNDAGTIRGKVSA